MALNRRAPEGLPERESTFENLAEGEHEGRLVYVADLGLQRKEYKGEYKGDIQQISLGIEILGKGREVEKEDGTKVFVPRLMFTKPFYIYSTAALKSKELEFYRVFEPTAKEDCTPDWEAQLGKPCNVIVVHAEGKGDNVGKTYDNIGSLAAIPAKYQDKVDPATITPAIGDADDPDNVVNKALHGVSKYALEHRVTGEASDTTEPSAEDDPFS